VLDGIPKIGSWLDVGCGSGALAIEWAREKREGAYTGIDFSPVLLDEAKTVIEKVKIPAGLEIHFERTNLAAENWSKPWRETVLNGVMAFAVLHHIPGRELRLRLLGQINRLLPRGCEFIHSEWQFQNDAKLMTRRQPWEKAGLKATDVDEGDTLLDWRHALPGQAEQIGLRYVHIYRRTELNELAELSGFKIVREFESDGKAGNLSLYQTWRKT
jgi:tRNA (uracil-5-)-methyltransferase TRM9